MVINIYFLGFDASSSTPTVANLLSYDAVLVFCDNPFADGTSLGDNLATYIDQGGGVVDVRCLNRLLHSIYFSLCLFFQAMFLYSLSGAILTPPYRVVTSVNQQNGSPKVLGAISLPSHPLMAGVSSFNGGASSYIAASCTVETGEGAYLVASYASGEPLIAAKDNVGPFLKSRVHLNFYPASADARSDFWVGVLSCLVIGLTFCTVRTLQLTECKS